jgi:hypothetical protein
VSTVSRKPGCTCHWEEGDSLCRVHPPDVAELLYAASLGAPYRFDDLDSREPK